MENSNLILTKQECKGMALDMGIMITVTEV